MATPARMQFDKWSARFARESKRNPIGGARLAQRRREILPPQLEPEEAASEYRNLCIAPPTFSSKCTCGGAYSTRVRASPAVPSVPERPASQPRSRPRRPRKTLATAPAELVKVERTMLEIRPPNAAKVQQSRRKLGATPLGHPPRRRYIIQKNRNGTSSIFARQKAARTGTARVAVRPVPIASWSKHIPPKHTRGSKMLKRLADILGESNELGGETQDTSTTSQ
jgi:hypothetical protein